MNNYDDFINELLQNDDTLKKENELLALKYDIIKLLIDYRRKNNISQTEFAEKIEVKQQMISRFEQGEIDPRISFISKILHGMNLKVSFSSNDYQIKNNVLKFNNNKKEKDNFTLKFASSF